MEYTDFLDSCLTPHHTKKCVVEVLETRGFRQWCLGDPVATGNHYFVFQTLVVVFRVPASPLGFSIVGTHSDSPVLKLKPKPVSKACGMNMVSLKPYGGGLWHTWFDREMGLAGLVSGEGERLVTVREPVLYVPSLAIHSAHDIYKDGFSYNKEEQLRAILQWEGLEELVSDAHDLSLFDLRRPVQTSELVYSARQDNIHSTYCALRAILEEEGRNVSILGIFDNEEVGSETVSGARSALFVDVLESISQGAGLDWRRAKKDSFFISADVAHAGHPNYQDRFERNHPVYLGGGPVIKHGPRYATNVYSSAYVKRLAKGAGVPVQEAVTKNGVSSGGTIGSMVAAKTGIATCDVGAPLLGMHSVREVTAVKDLEHLTALFRAFYGTK